MAETSHGLKIQASNAIARNTELRQKLQATINTNLNDETSMVEVEVGLLRSLVARLNEDSALLQKMDRKIDSLNDQLFNT